MELAQLEAFLAVVRAGSFSAAAKALYRTQPAISQTIKRLEDEVGRPLFDRASRRGLLTDAGRVLAVHAERLLCRLTGAETAAVVNNNAAATIVSLAALAIGAVCMTVGYFKVKAALRFLNRSREEFQANLRWIKQAIRQSSASPYRR